MKLVILESPYAGNVARNLAYGDRCLRDSLMKGEAPIASHMLYTRDGVLDDTKPDERAMGIAAGLEWDRKADMTVVYDDYGLSAGMLQGIAAATRVGRPVEYRTIGKAESE